MASPACAHAIREREALRSESGVLRSDCMVGPRSSDPRPSAWGWLRPVVSLVLLVSLAFVVDVRSTFATLREVSVPILLLLILVNTSAYVLFATRWAYFCRRLGLLLPRGGYLRGVYLFQITSQVVPSPLLGEAGRLAAFPSHVRRRDVVKSIALDRISNQFALVGCVTLLAPYYATLDLPIWLRWLLPLPGLVLVGGLLVVRRLSRSRLRERFPLLRRLHFLRILAQERLGARPLVLGVGLCLVLGLEFYLAAIALPLSGPVPISFALLVPLLTLALTMLPISIGDWGTRELVSVIVLAATGLSAEDVVAASILVGITNLLASLPGLYFIARRHAHPAELAPEDGQEER